MKLPSMDLTDIVTYLSLIVAIAFFMYQEISKRRNKTKEVQRLKDEFINMIIRNHINSNLEIVQVDFDTVISGFEKLKSCKLLYSKKDLLEMIYAKVSDNEHIESRVRINILKQTKVVLTELDQTENNQEQPTNKWYSLIVTFGASMVTFGSLLLGSGLVIKENILPEDPIIIVGIVTIFTYAIFKLQPLLNNIIEFLFITERENKEVKRNNDYTKVLTQFEEQFEAFIEENKEQVVRSTSEEQPLRDNDKKTISLNEYLKDGGKIIRVSELRILLEYKLNEYFDEYFQMKQEQKIKPNSFGKIVSMLETENALSEDEAGLLKIIYSHASSIIHGAGDVKNNIELSDFINDVEIIIQYIDRKISNLN